MEHMFATLGGIHMLICIGMDVHAKKLTCYGIPFDEGDVEAEEFCTEFNREFKVMSGEKKDMIRLSKWLKDVDHSILIESGSKTHEVFWTLTDNGCTVVVANANDLFRITMSVKKTDFHDCRELASYMRRRMLGEKEFSVCLMVDSVWLNRRQMCRLYAAAASDLSDLRRRIRSYMLVRGITIEDLGRDIVSEASLKKLEEVADVPMGFLIEEARWKTAEQKRILKAIEKEFADVPYYNLLKSIRGFGPVTSSYLTAMIIDIKRFDSPAAFAAYFGIVPKQRESAGHSKHCGITRRGDDVARQMLLTATMVHVGNDRDRVSSITNMYYRLRARGMPNKKAMTACTNKMTRIIYAILKDGREYRE
jgi:transposase